MRYKIQQCIVDLQYLRAKFFLSVGRLDDSMSPIITQTYRMQPTVHSRGLMGECNHHHH